MNISKELLVINQWQNVNYVACSSTNNCLNNGSSVISYYSMNTSNWSIDFIAIVLLLVGLRLFSFIILLLITSECFDKLLIFLFSKSKISRENFRTRNSAPENIP